MRTGLGEGLGDREEKRSCNLHGGRWEKAPLAAARREQPPCTWRPTPQAGGGASPRKRAKRAPQGGQIQPPQAGSGQLRPRALGLPGTPAPCKSILMAVAGHADSLTPHPLNALVSSLETGPSPRSCRRRLRAPFTFSRPSHPEGRRCRRRRPRTPPPSGKTTPTQQSPAGIGARRRQLLPATIIRRAAPSVPPLLRPPRNAALLLGDAETGGGPGAGARRFRSIAERPARGGPAGRGHIWAAPPRACVCVVRPPPAPRPPRPPGPAPRSPACPLPPVRLAGCGRRWAAAMGSR